MLPFSPSATALTSAVSATFILCSSGVLARPAPARITLGPRTIVGGTKPQTSDPNLPTTTVDAVPQSLAIPAPPTNPDTHLYELGGGLQGSEIYRNEDGSYPDWGGLCTYGEQRSSRLCGRRLCSVRDYSCSLFLSLPLATDKTYGCLTKDAPSHIIYKCVLKDKKNVDDDKDDLFLWHEETECLAGGTCARTAHGAECKGP